MSAMQRTKGAAHERWVAKQFRKVYPSAKRGLSQPRSGREVPDVDGTPFWVEAKHRKRVNMRGALEEAWTDAGQGRNVPLVVARDNGKADVVVMYLDDFLELAAETSTARSQQRSVQALGALAEAAQQHHGAVQRWLLGRFGVKEGTDAGDVNMAGSRGRQGRTVRPRRRPDRT